jgi:hypothetical protein
MTKTKRVAVFFVCAAGVLLCSLMLFVLVIATQGVVISHPKYYESQGPFSYTIHDWLGDMPMFFLNASPFIFGTTAAIFGLYWWLNQSDTSTRSRALIHATRAALSSLLFILAAIFIGQILVYKEAASKITRLNTYGPPQ